MVRTQKVGGMFSTAGPEGNESLNSTTEIRNHVSTI